MTDTTAHEGYERIEWTDVRKGDVLFHENGDRLTVDHVGELFVGDASGRNLESDVWGRIGFFPYRRKPEMPTTPGAYLDKEGDLWALADSGRWRMVGSDIPFTPVEAAEYAPFTNLVPMPTEEQVAYAICNAMRHTGDRECEHDHEATDAVMALLGGGDDE